MLGTCVFRFLYHEHSLFAFDPKILLLLGPRLSSFCLWSRGWGGGWRWGAVHWLCWEWWWLRRWCLLLRWHLTRLTLKISIILNHYLFTIKKSHKIVLFVGCKCLFYTSSLWIKAWVSRSKLSASWSLIRGSLCTDWSTLIWTSTEPLLCERGNKWL